MNATPPPRSAPAPYPLSEFCQRLGIAAPPVAASLNITGIATLDAAEPGEATFLTRPRLKNHLSTTRAAVVLVPKTLGIEDPRALVLPDVWAGVLELLRHFHPTPSPRSFVHPTAVVEEGVQLGGDVDVGPCAVLRAPLIVGNRVRIGAHCILGPDVTVGDDCEMRERVTVYSAALGKRVLLHSGVVVGSDGFKYEVIGGRLTKIPQVGRVVIEDDVEIGANSTIDRASFEETRIGARTKIDNLVHIAHNVSIGSDCILAAQVGIAGSSKIGRGVIAGGQVGIADNVEIGDGVQIAAQSGVSGRVAPGRVVGGTPAEDIRDWRRGLAVQRRLVQLWPRLRVLLGADSRSDTTEVDVDFS